MFKRERTGRVGDLVVGALVATVGLSVGTLVGGGGGGAAALYVLSVMDAASSCGRYRAIMSRMRCT